MSKTLRGYSACIRDLQSVTFSHAIIPRVPDYVHTQLVNHHLKTELRVHDLSPLYGVCGNPQRTLLSPSKNLTETSSEKERRDGGMRGKRERVGIN